MVCCVFRINYKHATRRTKYVTFEGVSEIGFFEESVDYTVLELRFVVPKLRQIAQKPGFCFLFCGLGRFLT